MKATIHTLPNRARESKHAKQPDFAAINAQAQRDNLWVLPACLDPREKHPAIKWKVFQQRRPTGAQLSFWLARFARRNGCYLTGALLGRIVLDCDDKGALAWARRKGLPKTQTVITRRGRHFHFAHPGFHVANTAGVIRAHVDIRGDRGVAVAVASIHESGFVYKWAPLRSPRDVKLAKIPKWLLVWLREREARRVEPAAAQTPIAVRVFGGVVSPWAAKAIDGELLTLSEAAHGTRNDALARCSFKLGQLAGGGEADSDDLLAAIYLIACAWPNSEKSRDTIRRAFDAGALKPRSAPNVFDIYALKHGLDRG